jgi:hypothetical protein
LFAIEIIFFCFICVSGQNGNIIAFYVVEGSESYKKIIPGLWALFQRYLKMPASKAGAANMAEQLAAWFTDE